MTALVAEQQQVENITEQLYTAPTNNESGSSIKPRVSHTVEHQMAPSMTPYPALRNIAPSWAVSHSAIRYQRESATMRAQQSTALFMQNQSTKPVQPGPTVHHTALTSIEPDVSNTIKSQRIPSVKPRLAPADIAHNMAIVPNVTSTKRYQKEPPTIKAQPNTASIIQQSATESVHPTPTVALPSALPRQMRVITCAFCCTKTQTDNYTYVDCSNTNCSRRICLLDNCFNGFVKRNTGYFETHQYKEHLIKGNPYQCYSCKAPKHRGPPSLKVKSCSVCGVNWCLVGDCTYETPFLYRIYNHIASKHEQP